MAVDLNPLRQKFYAATYITFPNEVRDIIDSLKQGSAYQKGIAGELEQLDMNTEEGRRLARAKLSQMFRLGGRKKTRRGRKVRRTRKSRR